MDSILQDIRLAIRLILSRPLVSAIAVISLGLGIGATTAIFSITDSVFLRPLPIPEPSSLVYVTGPTRTGRAGVELADTLLDLPHPFESAAAYSETQFDISSDGIAQWVDGLWVSGSFFQTMRIGPFAGRLLNESDDLPGGGADGRVAVISYALWQRRFDGSASAVGAQINVNGILFTIIGIAPREFFGLNVGRSFDVAVPLSAAATLLSSEAARPGNELIARLRDGQTVSEANAALRALLNDVVNQPNFGESVEVVPVTTGRSPIRGQYERPLAILGGIVTFVLLIACANIANLMLAWAASRRQEWSVRAALGASKWRLVRQCMVDSAIVASLSAGIGLVVAFWSIRIVVLQLAAADALTSGQTAYGSARLFLDVSFDWRVMTFTTGVTACLAVLFGVAPALRASHVTPVDALKAGGVAIAGPVSRRFARIRSMRLAGAGLIVCQIALSLTLVITAGLFARTLGSLAGASLGFDPARFVVADLDLSRTESEPSTRLGAYNAVLDSVSSLPGVAAAALSLGVPPIGGQVRELAVVAGADPPADPSVGVNLVSSRWFEVLGIPLVEGRTFTDADSPSAAKVAMVNEAFARTFLANGDAIGRSITSFESPMEIVGVVGDVISGRVQDRPTPAIYVPLTQADGRLRALMEILLVDQGLTLTVHSSGPAVESLIPAIAGGVKSVVPQASITFRQVDGQIAALLTRERVLGTLSAFLSGLALLLAVLGLYGVVAYAVTNRRKEIALHMALGASTHKVIRAVVARVWSLIAVGMLIGIGVSVWSGRFISAFLYGVESSDLATHVVAMLLLFGVGTLAAWLPARKGTRLDPAATLRYE